MLLLFGLFINVSFVSNIIEKVDYYLVEKEFWCWNDEVNVIVVLFWYESKEGDDFRNYGRLIASMVFKKLLRIKG